MNNIELRAADAVSRLPGRLDKLTEALQQVTMQQGDMSVYLERIANATERVADSMQAWGAGSTQITSWSSEPKATIVPMSMQAQASAKRDKA